MEIVIKEHTFIDRDFSKNRANIIDLGACMGEFTMEFIERFGSAGNCVLVEANPNNILKMPDLIKNEFNVLNYYISPFSSGEMEFKEDPNSPYNGTGIFEYFGSPVIHKIPRISIGEIRNIYNLDRVDILKMDIEGSEYEIIESMEIQDFDGIDQITIEFHDFLDASLKKRTEESVNKISKMGYKIKSKRTDYMNGSSYYDTLFYK
jgi:FkbM family methyltransferase